MKFRIHEWLDTKRMVIFYGVQCKPENHHKYVHCFEDEKALIYTTEEEAEVKIAEIELR